MSALLKNGSPFEAELSMSEFNAVAGLVRDVCGIQLSENKIGLVKSRLQKRLRVQQLDNYSEYLRFVKSAEGKEELEELISAISTNVTGFNREPHHFEHFRENVIPGIISRLQKNEEVRIWSSGCSNGSEAYTAACAILEAYPKAGEKNLKILATDIDKYSLDIGNSGLYPQDMIEKMPSAAVERWFTKVDNKYQIDSAAMKLVSFKPLNLMAPWPLKRDYDVIFCRNVLIYFSKEDQNRLFVKFAEQLKPDGILYIGHSERVAGKATEVLAPIGSTTYQYKPNGINQ